MRPGVFVTGTDTGVGKTVVAACLVRRWGAEYWKPVQTGLAQEPGDSETVAALSGAGPDRIHAPRHECAAPLSPEAAAHLERRRIDLADFDLPPGRAPLVVEGAGGVLVPLGGGAVMADLMARLSLPVLVVARSTLGTINHSLLTVEALRARRISVWGVVLVGPEPDDNAETIAKLGKVAILAAIPTLPTPLTLAGIAQVAALLPAQPPLSTLAATEARPVPI
jgi:malonyl-CoA O-methyltransferase